MSEKNAALPPRPDATTGEPRPPRAPMYGSPSSSSPGSKGLAPNAPRGCGPTLETYVMPNRSALSGGAFTVVLLMAFLSVFYGFSWVSVWWMWLLVALPAVAIAFTMRGMYCIAGADWLRTRDGWVATYELTEISMHVNGSSVDLFLKDSSRRGVNAQIAHLQANRALWDLVYNGIRHSVASGAKMNSYARSALSLGER